MAVFKEKLPPVPVVQEYSSELYAVTADVFHGYHLYFTQKINSKKSRWVFVFKTQPNLMYRNFNLVVAIHELPLHVI